MDQPFKIGDEVRLLGTTTQGRVKGFSPRDKNLVLCEWNAEAITSYVPARSLELLAQGAEEKPSHPERIET